MKKVLLFLLLFLICFNAFSFDISGVWDTLERIHPFDQKEVEFSWGQSVIPRDGGLVFDPDNKYPLLLIGGFGSFPIKSIQESNEVIKVTIDFTRGGFDIELLIHPINDNQMWIEPIEGITMFATREKYVYNRFEMKSKTILYGILNDSQVRIRTAPNLESETIGYLNKGQKVELLHATLHEVQIEEMKSVWFEIKTIDGMTGWAFGWFIDITDDYYQKVYKNIK